MERKFGTVQETLDDLARRVAVFREAQKPDVQGRAQAAIDIIPKVQKMFDAHSGVFRTQLIHAHDWISVSVLNAKGLSVEVVQLKAENGVVAIKKQGTDWQPLDLTYDPIERAFANGVDAVTFEMVKAIDVWLKMAT